ncbi:MAG TPA: hypothetical protein VGE74_04690 [Gemmata sp.]
MSEPTDPKPRGFVCPECVGVRLAVYRTRRPRRGLIVRYRECSACGYREATEEQCARILKPKKIGVQNCTPTSDSAAA